MERSKITPQWPNALRWFLVQDLTRFTPWYFIADPDELAGAAQAFHREDVNGGHVFVFACRQDCDDFAGLALIDGKVSDTVIHFHPAFGEGPLPSPRTWDIVCGVYGSVFEFVSQRIVPDMQEWALTEDAGDL